MNDRKDNGRIVPAMHPTTMKLVGMLKRHATGDKDALTHEEIIRETGIPENVLYARIGTARRHVLNEDGIWWETMHGAKCIKRTHSRDIPGILKSRRRGLYRGAKRAVRIGQTMKTDELDDSERKDAFVQMAQLGTLVGMSSTTTTKQLEARGIDKKADPARLLEAWKATIT